MITIPGRSVALLIFFSLIISLLHLDDAFAQDKESLSDAIREMMDAQGVEATKDYFMSMNAAERSQYNIDPEGISELTNSYLEDGNMEVLIAISEISAPFMQDLAAQAMKQYEEEAKLMEEMAQQQEVERKTEAQQEPASNDEEALPGNTRTLEESREDLQQFTGLFGNPDEPESARQLWVNQSCDGTLVVGAMWGDAAPWWMQSESTNVFLLEDSFNNIRIEFLSGTNALEMHHNLEFMENPLRRVGPLPEDFNSCIERYR